MLDHNFLQQAAGHNICPGSKESTRQTLGGIELTDYAIYQVIENSTTADDSMDVRSSAGSSKRAAVEGARPIKPGTSGVGTAKAHIEGCLYSGTLFICTEAI